MDKHPQAPPEIFSEDFDWTAKILYALSMLKQVTADEIADFIVELEGDAAQERVAEVHQIVKARLEQMQTEGSVKYGKTLPGSVHTYALTE